MVYNSELIKDALRQVLAEDNSAGISPQVIPPLEQTPESPAPALMTATVLDNFLDYKRYRSVSDGTLETYQSHIGHFAKQYPVLPLDVETVMGYIGGFTGETGRHKRNQHDRLNLLYRHAKKHFGVAVNPFDYLERPLIIHQPIRTLSKQEVANVDALVVDDTERAIWQLTVGHGWRQVEVRRVTAGDVRGIKDHAIWCRGKERDEFAPILPETQALLEQLAVGRQDDEEVIRSWRIRGGDTQPFGDDGLRKLIHRMMARTEISYRPHDLRRTFMTLVQEASGDELLATRLLRNRVLGVNDRYRNVSPGSLVLYLEKHSPIRTILTPELTGESLVETGESRTPRPKEAAQDLLQA